MFDVILQFGYGTHETNVRSENSNSISGEQQIHLDDMKQFYMALGGNIGTQFEVFCDFHSESRVKT